MGSREQGACCGLRSSSGHVNSLAHAAPGMGAPVQVSWRVEHSPYSGALATVLSCPPSISPLGRTQSSSFSRSQLKCHLKVSPFGQTFLDRSSHTL